MSVRTFEEQALALVAATVPVSRLCAYRVGSDLEPYAHVVHDGDTRWIDPYLRQFRQADPIHPRYFRTSDKAVIRLADATCGHEQLERYRDGFQKRIGIRYKVELFLRDRTGQIIAGVRLARRESLGDFNDQSLAALEAMQPILSSAALAARAGEHLNELERRMTPRESEILRAILDGVPNKVLCRRIGLALPTVKCHIRKVLRKSGASNRSDLITRIYRGPLS